MKVQLDEKGYVQNFVIIGESSACDIEIEEPKNFDMKHWNAYKFVDNALVLDLDKVSELEHEGQKYELRYKREKECFSVINRGTLWYEKLTNEQKMELGTWYQAWLDVTDTMVIPERLEWLV